mgnify:CR=1 FL=1
MLFTGSNTRALILKSYFVSRPFNCQPLLFITATGIQARTETTFDFFFYFFFFSNLSNIISLHMAKFKAYQPLRKTDLSP